ncbi:MAG: 5'-methylthioadenosine/S-adenosylhomocysteine nucleosidase [Maricaulaceae bacterium]|nr:5'-methylthioadenosine/S-adenosylhomocysteine nucleosidase [Maricaulaceae bacterium]
MTLPEIKDVHGLPVLFVMAAAPEYGPHLQTRIAPLITGVGPVEAAAATGAALARLEEKGRLPRLVFSLGSAGSRTLDHAGVYQVERLSYRDMDASPFGFEKGVTPFEDHPAEIVLPHRIPGIDGAALSTGATVISGAGYDAVPAQMVDMETFAVHRAAARFGLPMIGLRGISDGRAELTGLHDWTETLHLIDEGLANALDHFAACVADGRFRLD